MEKKLTRLAIIDLYEDYADYCDTPDVENEKMFKQLDSLAGFIRYLQKWHYPIEEQEEIDRNTVLLKDASSSLTIPKV